MELSKIRIEMARDPEFPEGSARHGYEFVAPLDRKRHIDAKAWMANRERCRVKRFWHNEPDEVGHLVRKSGGSWAFHYDIQGEDTDEVGYRLADERLIIGEYVSIREDEAMHTFRVASVEHV